MKFDVESDAYHRDPFPTLFELVERGPIVDHRVPIIGTFKFVTNHAAVSDFLKSADRFASNAANVPGAKSFVPSWLPKSFKILADNLLLMDDPEHRRLRKFVDAPFRKARIDEYRPNIAALANRLLDDMEARGEEDIVAGFARSLPLLVICKILGLRGEDQAKFEAWMGRFTSSLNGFTFIMMIPAIGKMIKYIRSEVEAARVDQRPGLLTELVMAEDEGDRLTDEELVSIIGILFVAGHETTTHLLSTGITTLLGHPEQLEMLRSDWSLAPQAVEELMRFNSPVQATKPRIVREDMEFQGVELRQGEKVMAMLASANADPSAFQSPEIFNIMRGDKARQTGWGGGIHMCLGMHLARAEAEIAFEQLFTRWHNIKVAVPSDQLKWINRIGIHGYRALPLKYDRAATSVAA